jgi:membrane protein DedA with SNARE-associated domain
METGVIKLILMTVVGFFLAQALSNQGLTPTRYIVVAFIVLSIPGFLLSVASLFSGGYEAHWREKKIGDISHYPFGLIALGTLFFIIFSGLLTL